MEMQMVDCLACRFAVELCHNHAVRLQCYMRGFCHLLHNFYQLLQRRGIDL
jgi:hypothetical protein